MMSAEKIAVHILKFIMGAVLLFMAVGFIFMILNINPAPDTISSPPSALFFTIAVGLLLSTPVVMSAVMGFVFLRDRQFLMSLGSFLLFIVLIASILIKMLGGSAV